MTKHQIIDLLLPYLDSNNTIKFQKFANSNFFRKVKAEATFQFFVCAILEQNGYIVIRLNSESKKSPYERYLHTYLGNEIGTSDLLVIKDDDIFFIELKASSEVLLKKNGIYRENKHVQDQVNYLRKMFSKNYLAFFLYPESLKEKMRLYFEIEL